MHNEKHCIQHYLNRYAETDLAPPNPSLTTLHSALKRVNKRVQWVLVIPVYDEALPRLQTLFNSLVQAADRAQQSVIVITVFNVPDTASPETVATNLDVFNAFVSWSSSLPETVRVVTLNRIHEPIPKKWGVGLARKIGADWALALIAEGVVTTQVILNTDADVMIPAAYFLHWQHALADHQAVAWTYPFIHIPDTPELSEITTEFDQYLNSYVNNLAATGSRHAYFALGSIIGVNAGAYAQVRGFPKKNGGEDFYLLNKLRKLGSVMRIEGEPLQVLARYSSRVPFGTGPRLQAAMKLIDKQPRFPLPSAEAFHVLSVLLSCIENLPEEIGWGDLQTACDEQANRHPGLARALDELGFQPWFEKCRKQRNQTQIKARFLEWFDGFRTLKLLNVVSTKHVAAMSAANRGGVAT